MNGIATLVGRVVSSFFPGLTYYEEGAYFLHNEEGDCFMEVSPDGSLRFVMEDGCTVIRIAVEVSSVFLIFFHM